MKTNTPAYRVHTATLLALEGLLITLLWLLPVSARAQAIQAWVQPFTGPEGEVLEWGVGVSAMALDPSNNVYVTGFIYPNTVGGPPPADRWVTLKYSSAGMPLWTNLYNGTNWPPALGVDGSGNAYVTGVSYGGDPASGGTFFDWTTIKYSSTGVPLWTNRFDGGHNGGADVALAVAVDSSGEAIVSGKSKNGPNWVYLRIKYSSAGAPLSTNLYNGSAIGPAWNDLVAGFLAPLVAVAANGNVYVTGTSGGDYVTVAFSSTGVLLWTKRYNGPGNFTDEPSAIAVDASNNVVVTGKSCSLNSYPYNPNFATIKYSSTGVPLWTNRYIGPANDGDYGKAVAVDTGGDVIVTGESAGGGTWSDFATIKYSSAGLPVWTNRYNGTGNGSDWGPIVALDANRNVYVTGTSAGVSGLPWNYGYATVAYSSTGEPLWTARYQDGEEDEPHANAMAVSASGDVYVTGTTIVHYPSSHLTSHFITLKYVIPAIITRQPLSCTNSLGTTASFSVEVAGSAPFSCQWRRQGTNLVNEGKVSGVTTTNLLVADVQPADAAGYSVVVTNAYGSAASQVAQLTVTIPPTPGRFSNLAWSPATGFSFIFRDGTVGQSYRIQRSPSMAEGSWVDWQAFTYTEPIGLTDVGAAGAERRFYRAVSP